MKPSSAKLLLSVMLFPLSLLFAGLTYEDVSGFLAQKGINLVESDVFHSKEGFNRLCVPLCTLWRREDAAAIRKTLRPY